MQKSSKEPLDQVLEFLKLVRIEHAIMLAVAVLIAETIVLGELPVFTPIIIFSLLVPVFSEMGSFALNDYLDQETDKINKKLDRPLVKGTIQPKIAYAFSIFAFLVSTLIAIFINIPVFVIAFVFNILAILYNFKLKDIPLIGNIYIAFTMAIPFTFGNFVISNELNPTILILALLGFLSGLAREIIKSVQDMDGDFKARGAKTLPIMIGKKSSLTIASFLYALFIPLTIAPFFLGLAQNPFSLLLVAIADAGIIYIIYSILRSPNVKTFNLARNISLASLFIGLIAYLIAVL